VNDFVGKLRALWMTRDDEENETDLDRAWLMRMTR
jgi:hypothetical protein